MNLKPKFSSTASLAATVGVVTATTFGLVMYSVLGWVGVLVLVGILAVSTK